MFKTEQGGIDWKATEEWAREQTHTTLVNRIHGIRLDLEGIDRQDRELGTDKGGFLRDEISVYSKVLKSR